MSPIHQHVRKWEYSHAGIGTHRSPLTIMINLQSASEHIRSVDQSHVFEVFVRLWYQILVRIGRRSEHNSFVRLTLQKEKRNSK